MQLLHRADRAAARRRGQQQDNACAWSVGAKSSDTLCQGKRSPTAWRARAGQDRRSAGEP
jgi:hypothetical protein